MPRLLGAFVVWLVALATTPTQAQQCDSNGVCDRHELCPTWQGQGLCKEERAYMQKHCPVSCRSRGAEPEAPKVCQDAVERCAVWADLGECEANPKNMKKYCPRSCDYCDATYVEPKQVETSTAGSSTTDDDDMVENPECSDSHELCSFWAEKGECDINPGYMKKSCVLSCGLCEARLPRRKLQQQDMAGAALLELSKHLGEVQRADGAQRQATLDRLQETMDYVDGEEFVHLPQKVKDNCKNRNALCTFWAVIGECEKNQAYMQTNCAVACMSCHMIDFETRCPPVPNLVPALLPGDMNQMFERIVETAPGNQTTLTDADRAQLEADNMTAYTVTVHSRPEPSTEVSTVVDKSMPPWVITLDNFLTPEECDGLIQLGYKYEYKRSEDVGAAKFDGSHEAVQSSRRTSENAWCSDHHGCRKEELAQNIHNRMSKVMRIPAENSEDLQMLKYEKGQFYRTHHDYIPHQKDRQCGPRILTFFLYLSDVEEGGGTNFPQLHITVTPKKGRALLWPSTYNSEPMIKDGRTTHQALDVEKGTKFATNGWIHMFDYQTPQKKGCN